MIIFTLAYFPIFQIQLSLFVCWVLCFQSKQNQQFSEVASVASSLFALGTPTIRGRLPAERATSSQEKRVDVQEMNSSCSYARPPNVTAIYESDGRLETCCILKPPIPVTFSPCWSLYKHQTSNTILRTCSTKRKVNHD